MTKALATIEKKARRVPGQAVETNPLVAAVMNVTEDQIHDLDKEIDATTNYLAGLKRVRQAFADVTGLDDSPEAVEAAVKQLPPAQEDRTNGNVTKVAGRAALKPGPPKGRKPSGCTLKITEILEANIDTAVPDVVAALRADGFNNPEHSLTSLIYVVRGRIRDKRGLTGEVAKAPRNSVKAALGTVGQTAQKPAEPKKPPEPKPPEPKKTTHLGGVVDDKGLREKVAEYVFKKGLVWIGDIIRDCGLDDASADAFMQHPWFEQHMGKWRLTKLGKEEGVSY